MDDIDARIIAALINDARASYALIGQQVGLSAPAVKRRVDRLRAAGAITGTESFPAKMTLEVPGLKISVAFNGDIAVQ